MSQQYLIETSNGKKYLMLDTVTVGDFIKIIAVEQNGTSKDAQGGFMGGVLTLIDMKKAQIKYLGIVPVPVTIMGAQPMPSGMQPIPGKKLFVPHLKR